MAGLPPALVNSADVLRAPKGKQLPVIDDDGTRMADSRFIIEHLKAQLGDPLDGALSPSLDSQLRRHMPSRPTLQACCQRMKVRYCG